MSTKDLKKDVVEELDLMGIRKLLLTLVKLIVDPTQVVSDMDNEERKFTKPLRFALTICAPVFLVFSILDFDISDRIVKTMMEGMGPDPFQRMFLTKISNGTYEVVFGNYSPLVNILLYAPLGGLLLYRFYRKEIKRPFYYFMGIALYHTGLTGLFGFLLSLVMVFGLIGTTPLTIIGTISGPIFLLNILMRGTNWSKPFVRGLLTYVLNIAVLGILFVAFILTAVFTGRGLDLAWAPRIGMGIVTKEISFGSPREYGMLVEHVQPNSPAEISGILPYDTLMRVNGAKVTSHEAFRIVMDSIKGTSVNVAIRKNGKDQVVRVECRDFKTIFHDNIVLLGWELGVSTTSEKSQSHYRRFVVDLDNGGAAMGAGIQVSDTILAYDDHPIKSFTEYNYFSYYYLRERKPGDTMKVTLSRSGTMLVVPVILQKRTIPLATYIRYY